MDAIANVILDVTFSSQVHKALNVVHPRPIEWNNVMHVISETLAQELKLKGPLPLVPFKTWLSTLDDNARNLSLEEQKNIVSIFSFSAHTHIILIPLLYSPLSKSWTSSKSSDKIRLLTKQTLSQTQAACPSSPPPNHKVSVIRLKQWHLLGRVTRRIGSHIGTRLVCLRSCEVVFGQT